MTYKEYLAAKHRLRINCLNNVFLIYAYNEPVQMVIISSKVYCYVDRRLWTTYNYKAIHEFENKLYRLSVLYDL